MINLIHIYILQIHTLRVDDFAYLTDFTDDALRAIVRQQPVIGILRNTGVEFGSIRSVSFNIT